MSTVPPSPPWPTTRMSSRPLRAQRRGDAGGHGGGVGEQRVDPRQLPRGLGVRGGEDLEAAGRVGGDQPPAGRAQRGVERVAGAERLAASLAGAMALGDRVGALGVGLHGALVLRRAAGCRPRRCRSGRSARCAHTGPARDERRARAGCSRRAGPDAAVARCGLELALDDVAARSRNSSSPSFARIGVVRAARAASCG